MFAKYKTFEIGSGLELANSLSRIRIILLQNLKTQIFIEGLTGSLYTSLTNIKNTEFLCEY